MSDSSLSKTARKRLTLLGVIILALAGVIGAGTFSGAGATLTPKLALDLQGGTQIILSPLLADGQTVSEEQLAQAVEIIRQRVDATGVSEASVKTQGNTNIIVEIPGSPDESTLKLIRSSAKLEFRPVILASQNATAATGEVGSLPEPTVPNATPTDASDSNWVTPEIQAAYNALDCTTAFREAGQVDDPAVPLVTCDTNGFEK